MKYGFGAVLPHATDLDQRRVQGHDNGCRCIESLAVESHGHAMVARTGGNHAAHSLVLRERQQAVESSSFLERAGHLQVVEFKKYSTPRYLADSFRIGKRRKIDLVLDPLAGFFDVDKSNHLRATLE